MNTYDAIVVGAGHNGLAAAKILSGNGYKVLVVEKNTYVGGMAGTREILKGCRNETGASCLFPLSKQIIDELEFEKHGVEFIDLPVMATNLAGSGAPPLIFYSKPVKQITHIIRQFGFSGMLGFIRLMLFCKYPADILDRFTPRRPPRSFDDVMANTTNPKKREQLKLAFEGSAMDIIDRFLPDKTKHRALRAMMAFAAIQSTYKGPYTPGSALCLVYTLAQDGSGGLMRRVKGGMGALSEALKQSVEGHGGEVRTKAEVEKIVIEKCRAIGVQMKNGEQIHAKVVLSNIDKQSTFFRLVGEDHLEKDYSESIRRIEHKGAYIHLLFKLKSLPHYSGEWSGLNQDIHNRFGVTIVPDPDQLQKGYEACLKGKLPERFPVALQIPSIMDPTLATEGFHTASAYGFYFPCDAPKEEHGLLRNEMVERVIQTICQYMPDFRDCIAEKAVFSSDHFASMFGVTQGDFTHGLIHPDQMIGSRCTMKGNAHKTPIPNLYLCGAACHPGPGVTFLPGYNCAYEVLSVLKNSK